MTNISQNNQKPNKIKGKKILYLVTQTKWGGAQKYVLELAQYMSKHNEVHVASGKPGLNDQKFINELNKANIKFISIPYLAREIDLGKDYLTFLELNKLLKKEKYNLIHLNSSKTSIIGALSANTYIVNPINPRLRLVYTAHGFVFNEPLSKFKKTLYKFSEKIAAKTHSLIITVSEADRQSALNNKIGFKHRLFTVHNGLNFNQYTFQDKKQALKLLNLSANKKYFGTIANFYKTKGYKYLLKAITILKANNSPLLSTHQWILIGDGPELENIKQQAQENNLNDYIKFLGNKKNAWQYLKAFDYFILPSVKEGLPYSILEAGLAKVPIITTKVGGIPEIITDKKTGLLIEPADSQSLAKAIDIIVNNNSEMLENNYQNIIKKFNSDQMIANTEKLYLKLF